MRLDELLKDVNGALGALAGDMLVPRDNIDEHAAVAGERRCAIETNRQRPSIAVRELLRQLEVNVGGEDTVVLGVQEVGHIRALAEAGQLALGALAIAHAAGAVVVGMLPRQAVAAIRVCGAAVTVRAAASRAELEGMCSRASIRATCRTGKNSSCAHHKVLVHSEDPLVCSRPMPAREKTLPRDQECRQANNRSLTTNGRKMAGTVHKPSQSLRQKCITFCLTKSSHH
jgi:hypothetical protein